MGSENPDKRLSGISTVWTVLRQANDGSKDSARAAQELLVRRYGGAVYRYLLRALGDASAAEDLAQEFALGLVRGDYRHADPQRGRFRNYVKSVLFHLVSKHRRGQGRQPQPFFVDPLQRGDRHAFEQGDAAAQALLEVGDLAAHRGLGDGGDLGLLAHRVGDLVDALDGDQGRVHVEGDQPEVGQAQRRADASQDEAGGVEEGGHRAGIIAVRPSGPRPHGLRGGRMRA